MVGGQAEAQAKEEALVRLREEETRRAEAEARAKDMEEELKVQRSARQQAGREGQIHSGLGGGELVDSVSVQSG